MRQADPTALRVAPSDDQERVPSARSHTRAGNGRPRYRATLISLLIAAPLLAGGQASIDWWSVDGGGEIQAEGADWTLSGTLGQWDSTEGNLLTGGSWQLTGGFWAVEAPASDGLFIDSFEN